MIELFEKLISSHSAWGIIVAYAAGVAASFSPCIYPLIPITMGIIGAYSRHSHIKGFLLSFFFVLGISFVFALLGLISSLLGIFLGNLMVNPLTYSLIGLFLLFLGLCLWDALHFKFHTIAVHLTKKHSLFVVGMMAGFAAIPCIFPVMGMILSLISLKKDLFYGISMLCFFSLGYGTVLLVLGTFSSLISKLPKSGAWLIMINRCIGTFLLLFAAYFFVKAFQLL